MTPIIITSADHDIDQSRVLGLFKCTIPVSMVRSMLVVCAIDGSRSNQPNRTNRSALVLRSSIQQVAGPAKGCEGDGDPESRDPIVVIRCW